MGFITADIEYIANKDVRYSFPLDDNGNQPDNSYFDPLNNTIKSYYKNTFNFRLGGEYKVDEIAYPAGWILFHESIFSPRFKGKPDDVGWWSGLPKKRNIY